MDKLETKLIQADCRFKRDLEKEYDNDLEDLMSQKNIDHYLPQVEIAIYLTRNENNKDKIKAFVETLHKLVDPNLYYGPIIEGIAYEISPELSDYMTSLDKQL